MRLLVLLGILTIVHPFGFAGHRLSAYLTWSMLPSNVRRCLGFSNDKSSKIRFIRLACRPDYVKHKPGMKWAMPLHFYNTEDYPPLYCQRTFTASLNSPNLIKAALNFTRSLSTVISERKQLNATQQRDVLSYMLHFITDLHQPLHLSSRLQGGNKLKVRFNGQTRTLHILWDSDLLIHLEKKRGNVGLMRLIRKRVRYLKSKLWTLLLIPDVDELILSWAAETNAANCRLVWKGLFVDDDLAKSYFRRVSIPLLDLLIKSSIRTSHLLKHICELHDK